MEEINKELDNKSIERTEIKEVVKEEKPKKTRTEAQKQAFEKARKKREANLKARKEAEELDAWAEEELQREDPQPVIKPPPKKRGRPRKKKVEEQPAQQFISPPDPQLAGQFPVQGQIPMNPYQQFQYYQPPPQPAPVNNYYYYGAPPPKEEPKPDGASQTNKPDSSTKQPVFEPPMESEPSPYGSIHSDEDYEDEIDYDTYANEQASQLKYRFA